jgi:DNA-binding XRE family transcriptional regulator
MAEQYITTPEGERLVVLPEADYEALRDLAEDHADRETVGAFRNALAAGREELVPAAFADRLMDGENKIRVWREYRGLTARDLAERAGISAAYLSQIESGLRDGSFDTIKRIAAALNISLDDLA